MQLPASRGPLHMVKYLSSSSQFMIKKKLHSYHAKSADKDGGL